MGLDVAAFKTAKYVRSGDSSEVGFPFLALHHLYVNPDFVERADGLQTGLYDVGGEVFDIQRGSWEPHIDHLRFSAGSYTSYGEWRRWLALSMLGARAEDVWKHKIDFLGKPFYELIDFADNEGVIGPKTSAKLAEDFVAHRERAISPVQTMDDVGQWAFDLYNQFQLAFELAALTGHGVVEFH